MQLHSLYESLFCTNQCIRIIWCLTSHSAISWWLFFYCWRKRDNQEMWSHTHTTIALQINDKPCVIFLLWTVRMLHIYVYVYCFYVYDIACQNFTHIKAIYIYIHTRNLSYANAMTKFGMSRFKILYFLKHHSKYVGCSSFAFCLSLHWLNLLCQMFYFRILCSVTFIPIYPLPFYVFIYLSC